MADISIPDNGQGPRQFKRSRVTDRAGVLRTDDQTTYDLKGRFVDAFEPRQLDRDDLRRRHRHRQLGRPPTRR